MFEPDPDHEASWSLTPAWAFFDSATVEEQQAFLRKVGSPCFLLTNEKMEEIGQYTLYSVLWIPLFLSMFPLTNSSPLTHI